ncbi:hypothetical protein [uncultured Dubosiella sp.]|uniref:hypothetical protein n=1 Tax=uncultured Dubosiella sp. TaxID=1937011 RepID=UPI00261F33B6|nr:hypothetical protein [uncultured Dubosiella sp.]
MKKDYYTLLLWQGLCAGACFWIKEIGWLFTCLGIILVIIMETVLSQYAKAQQLQAFGTPFKGNKYLQDEGLLIVQLCFTILLWITGLILLSSYGLWTIFWIMTAAGIVCFTAFCTFFRQKRRKK